MKFLIASDLHGSSYYAKEIISVLEREQADMLILLGDVYNHGPRNPLPKDYAPMEVASLLNEITDRLLVIKGNCDSEVDTMISKFSFVDNSVIVSGGKKVFLTHGHVFNKDNLPSTNFDAIIYGHFHTGFVEKQGEMTIANAGSLSLPKGGTPISYLTLEDKILTLKELSGKVISETKI